MNTPAGYRGMDTTTRTPTQCPRGGRAKDGKCCYCRSKTVPRDAMDTVKDRVAFCCWCGQDRAKRVSQ